MKASSFHGDNNITKANGIGIFMIAGGFHTRLNKKAFPSMIRKNREACSEAFCVEMAGVAKKCQPSEVAFLLDLLRCTPIR